jgi:hypothetical protein
LNYDSPGFSSPIPGAGSGTDRAGTAPGSDGVGFAPNDLATVGHVVVTTPGSSTVPGPQPAVSVDSGDSGLPSQTESLGPRGLSAFGISAGWSMSETGAGRGQANHMRHPNNGSTS